MVVYKFEFSQRYCVFLNSRWMMIAVCGCGASAHTFHGFQFTLLGLFREFLPLVEYETSKT